MSKVDLENATEAELESIKNAVVRRLAKRSAFKGGTPDSLYDRHGSVHSKNTDVPSM